MRTASFFRYYSEICIVCSSSPVLIFRTFQGQRITFFSVVRDCVADEDEFNFRYALCGPTIFPS
jgi:hypothetical protein